MGDASNQQDRLDAVFENLKRLYRENRNTFPKNILLIGMPAAGKSSLVNLLHAAFNGEYTELAKPGSPGIGDDDSVTEHLLHYENMGLSEEELKNFIARHTFDEEFEPPNIIDMPGIRRIETNDKDADEEHLRSIHRRNIDYVLKYVIDGIVPTEAQIASVLSGEQNLSGLRRDEKLKVDRVIFVISIKQDIDEQMLRNVMKVISGNNGKQKVIPYTVIFTHVDCVGDNSDEKVPTETANRRKKIAAGILKIGNNMKLNSDDLSNYSDADDVDEVKTENYKTDLKKHVKAIQALNKLCTRKNIIADRPAVSDLDLMNERGSRIVESVLDHKFKILVPMTIILFAYYVKSYGFPLQEIKQVLQYLWNAFDALFKTLVLRD